MFGLFSNYENIAIFICPPPNGYKKEKEKKVKKLFAQSGLVIARITGSF
jgi:hypothetical protein